MEMFFLSYVNELCIYLDSAFVQVVSTQDSEQIRAQQTSMFYSYSCSPNLC